MTVGRVGGAAGVAEERLRPNSRVAFAGRIALGCHGTDGRVVVAISKSGEH